MIAILWFALFLSPSTIVLPENVKDNTYCNSRFQYCINYPKFLVAKPESANGDGRIFTNKDGNEILRVYGRLNQDENGNPVTLKRQYLLDIQHTKSGKFKITYQKLAADYYVLSGEKGNTIFYKKVITKQDAFCFASLNYPKLEKNTYDPVSAEIYKTFR